MTKAKGKKCCASTGDAKVSHHIEAIITIDERGQMVLPKEARARAGIQPGDKLALLGWRKGDRVCCFSLIKVDVMAEMVGELVQSLITSPSSEE